MEATETRQVGKHLFIFEKGNQNNNGRTLITSYVAADSPTNDEKLPSEFIKYMRKLFDLLDEQKRGVVKLSDIEERWGSRNGGTGQFRTSSTVLENLRRVTPADGLLSFDRLCLGFQLALRPTDGKLEALKLVNTSQPCEKLGKEREKKHVHTRSQGDEKSGEDQGEGTRQSQRPRRPRSMVQLRQQKEPLDLSLAKRKGGILEGIQKTDKKTVVEKLRQWQKGELRKADKIQLVRGKSAESPAETSETLNRPRPNASEITNGRRHVVTAVLTRKDQKGNEGDGGRQVSRHNSTNKDQCSRIPRVRVYYKGEKVNKNGLNGGSRETVVQKDDARVVAKDSKLKDLDKELQILDEGLRAVEDVRDWFFTRITALQEEKLYVKSATKYSVQNLEAMMYEKRRQELGLISSDREHLVGRIEELKSHLAHIMKPYNMSLSTPKNCESANERRIGQLEREKRLLIRELFQHKAQKSMSLEK